jgi:hypothetical protein
VRERFDVSRETVSATEWKFATLRGLLRANSARATGLSGAGAQCVRPIIFIGSAPIIDTQIKIAHYRHS